MKTRTTIFLLSLAASAALGCSVRVGVGEGSAGASQAGTGTPGNGTPGNGTPGNGTPDGSGAAGESGTGAGGEAAGGQTGGAGTTGSGAGPSGGGATAGGAGGTSGGNTFAEPKPALDGALDAPSSCTELEKSLKAAASAEMNASIDRWIAYYKAVYANSAGEGTLTTGGKPTAPDADEAKLDYSKTNLQVEGVDEADFVKSDGEQIYLLHGNVFSIVKATPAASMEFITSLEIEGYPVEMMVESGHAIIYSLVDGTSVYKAAGVSPKPYLTPDGYGYPVAFTPPGDIAPEKLLTKVTIVHMPELAANVMAESYYEGAYVSSRRVDKNVRTVIQGGGHGPTVSQYPSLTGNENSAEAYRQAYEKLRKDNQAAIDASTIDDYLPYRFSKASGKVTASKPACDEYAVPREGSTQYGLTTLQSIDWDSLTTPKHLSVAAMTQVVYGTASSIYLSAVANEDPYATSVYSIEPPKAGTVQSLSHTYLHRIDFPAASQAPTYAMSGTLKGSILNQFSLDEHDGALRVAVQENRYRWKDDSGYVYPETEKTNHAYVLKPNKGGTALEVVGSVLDLAPGQNLRASRFIEGRGYIITFEDIDPLHVLDLSKPDAPFEAGKLDQLPGFGEYIHPIDAGHLMTIGKKTKMGDLGVLLDGIQISVFDVSDPKKPSLVDQLTVSTDSHAYSEAENNHKAFAYVPEKGVLMFPLYHTDPDTYETSSVLKVLKVDAKAYKTSELGEIVHDDLFGQSTLRFCLSEGEFTGRMRRGMFIGDLLYSVSYAGVRATSLTDLAKPVGTLPLQSPEAENFKCAPPN